MPERLTLAVDQGTHASRAVLYGPGGARFFRSSVEVGLHRREGGRVEQSADEILAATRRVIDDAREWSAARGHPIEAAGLAVQRSTVVAWDRTTGRPLAPALSWQDTRAADRLVALGDRAAAIAERTGLRLSPHYGATKIAWMLSEVAAVREAQHRGSLAVGPLAAFLLAGLRPPGPPQVDEVNASRTLLWELASRSWSAELAGWFEVPPELLPEGRPVLGDWGELSAGAVPLRAVTGDQNAAIFADGPLPPGVARVNLGTGAFVLAATGARISTAARLLRGVARSDAEGPEYLVEGTVNGAGAALEWAASHWDLPDPDTGLEEAFAESTGEEGGAGGDPEGGAPRLAVVAPRLPERAPRSGEPDPPGANAGRRREHPVSRTREPRRDEGGRREHPRVAARRRSLAIGSSLRAVGRPRRDTGGAWGRPGGHRARRGLAGGRSARRLERFEPSSDPELERRYRMFLEALERRLADPPPTGRRP